MIQRIHELDANIPITMVYGSRSWMDVSTGNKVKELRPHSYVDVQQIDKAGHHVYSDNSDKFNEIVGDVCNRVYEDLQQMENS
jgi:pimeloyl-ACP methyl ester carboxylesterase